MAACTLYLSALSFNYRKLDLHAISALRGIGDDVGMPGDLAPLSVLIEPDTP